MRKMILSVLAISGAVFATAPDAFSQDGAPVEYEVTDPERERYERERIIASPGEGDYRYLPPSTPPAAKDTATAAPPQVVPAVPNTTKPQTPPARKPEKSGTPPSRGEDDSILSFNFLYYIIQKYKLQDIID